MRVVFNETYRLGKIIAPPSQDEILNTPEFFAMSVEDICKHPRCPEHLKRILMEFEWVGRPNFVQVRPQDFRSGHVAVLGSAWHVDVNTPLMNGRMHWARDLYEYRSMVASFGYVTETEFVKKPFAVDIKRINPMNHPQFASFVDALNPETVKAEPNQLCVYTGLDAHRVAPHATIGRARLIIVTVELDAPIEKEGGAVGPSILEREKK